MTAFERKAGVSLEGLRKRHRGAAPGKPCLVGVSGGRDSVALLHYLVAKGWTRLVVAHLNHGLRGRESGQDALFVRRLATKMGLPLEIRRTDVSASALRSGLSLETAARQERDAFFRELMKKHRTRFVFLGHHAEDHAETILGNLFRGAGLQGIGGMRASSAAQGGLIKLRPLLEVRRAEVDEYLRVNGWSFREDSSNTSAEHRRNRLRHEVLPLLSQVFQRDTVPLVARFAQLAEQDNDCLEGLSRAWVQDHGLLLKDRGLRVTDALLALHPALQSRILRRWLREIHQVPNVGHREAEAALTTLRAPGSAANLPGDAQVRHVRGVLSVRWLRPRKRR